ncbi:MAG: glycogen debranching protein [Gemmatimonadetes bacterium]|nr:glycogen debranching protein [Gemmatimonadota bacterium]
MTHLSQQQLVDLNQSLRCEWIEPNGLGGWASSTVSGAHTRRYHGLLVAAVQPPVDRRVLLSRLDETLHLMDGPVELTTSLFPGAVQPEGYQWLTEFSTDPVATFHYRIGDIVFVRTIAAVHGRNATIIRYHLAQAQAPARLELRPLYAGRDYHQLVRANDDITRTGDFTDDVFSYAPYEGQTAVRLHVPGSRFSTSDHWYYNYQYPREEERGLDSEEDLFSPGLLTVIMRPGETLTVVAAADDGDLEGEALYQREIQRRSQRSCPPLLQDDPVGRRLVQAADAFLVRRGDERATILAGYHWFADWGRDTMISLPGICLVTGRFDEARRVLQAFADASSSGLIPNRFPDVGETPEYNTVDATLWFFHALRRYVEVSGDQDLARQLWPLLQQMLDAHRRGTRYGIGVDVDGLLKAGQTGSQLTWMDAKVGEWVVTPRIGKPVEIQALWINALDTAARFARLCGDDESAAVCVEDARRAATSFARRFWNEDRHCLYDLVDGPNGDDAAIRPNQLLALSLPVAVVDDKHARQILTVVERDLLTPRGLRSLAPQDAAYRGVYHGSPVDRDGAYHQGTVWGWLMGPYLSALVRFGGDRAPARARRLIDGFAEHLDEAGLDSISEVFDGDAPHAPKGCFAQAWSVAELLRALWEDVLAQDRPEWIPPP